MLSSALIISLFPSSEEFIIKCGAVSNSLRAETYSLSGQLLGSNMEGLNSLVEFNCG